jgi:hypothetical protein
VSVVVVGLIAATGARIWAAQRVDLASPRNLLTAAVALTAGAGDLTVRVGGFATGGTCTATFRAILLYHLLSGGETGSSRRAGTEADGAPADRWRFECQVGEAPRPGEAAAHPPRAATPSAGASRAWPTLRSRFWRTRAQME